jgi:hypothetical protein
LRTLLAVTERDDFPVVLDFEPDEKVHPAR